MPVADVDLHVWDLVADGTVLNGKVVLQQHFSQVLAEKLKNFQLKNNALRTLNLLA